MIRVAVWGAGMMGQGLLRYILDRPNDLELVGVIDRHPEKHGMTLNGLLGEHYTHDVAITADHDAVLSLRPDVVCVLTASNLHEITDQVEAVIRADADVICIAETLAYPWASDSEWAERIDELAREHGVSVLGTGINPGFILDALPIALSSVCLRIDRIEASRINDLSPFGPTVMLSQGVGTTVEQFEAGIADGSIVGHIGFQESIGLIAYALGWEIARVEETREPIISNVERSTPHVHVAPGNVAGCRHIARAYDAAGELKIELVHPQQIHPELEGVETGDYIRIVGEPTINVSNCPEVPGGKGTYASVGNYIPLIGTAAPGIITVVDMPLPRFASPTV